MKYTLHFMNTLSPESVTKAESVWPVVDKFWEDMSLVEHQIKSFDEFTDRMVPEIIKTSEEISIEAENEDEMRRKVVVKFHSPYFLPPQITEADGSKTFLKPHECRLRNITYAVPLSITIDKTFQITNIDTGEFVTNSFQSEDVIIGRIPLLTRSSLCSVKDMDPYKSKECFFDPGGYFIVNGGEKTIITQHRMANNEVNVFETKDDSFVAEIRSTMDGGNRPPSILKIELRTTKQSTNKILKVHFPYLKKEAPLMVIFKALGIVDNREIIEQICGLKDLEIINILTYTIEDSFHIKTQNQALEWIGKNSNIVSEKDKRIDSAKSILEKELFLHIGSDDLSNTRKADFLAYMVRKLLDIALGRRPFDGRDHEGRKRGDPVGVLMASKFSDAFMKVHKDCQIFIEKRITSTNNSNKDFTIASMIDLDKITKDLNYAISTGNWGTKSFVKTGVSQVLSRLNPMAAISHLRKFSTPLSKNGTSAKPRQLHNSQFMYQCPAETPEGGSTGLIKNLAQSTYFSEHFDREIVLNFLESLSPEVYQSFDDEQKIVGSRVFVNGFPAGKTKKPIELNDILDNQKAKALPFTMGVVLEDTSENIIRIYTDVGRPCRPVFKVKNNKLLLTDKHLIRLKREQLDRNKKRMFSPEMLKFCGLPEDEAVSRSKITHLVCEYIKKQKLYHTDCPSQIIPNKKLSNLLRKAKVTEQFKYDKTGSVVSYFDLEKYIFGYQLGFETTKSSYEPLSWMDLVREGIIIYLDANEQEKCTICPSVNELSTNDIFDYTHCEIHPSFMWGAAVSVIPYPDHNQSPRNAYGAGMLKQNVGTNTGNYQYRMDTMNHVLWYGQKPISHTHASKAMGEEELPGYGNAIVAIMDFTENQEDAVILNQSALDRGFLRSTFLRTYKDQETKTSTAEDCFGKSKNAHRQSVKIGEDGLVSPGMFVSDNEDIITKVNLNDEKKNSRISIRHGESGIVNKVMVTSTTTKDNTKLAKVEIRQTRVPQIGDKFSCYDTETQVLTNKGWIYFKDLTKKHKVATLVDDHKLVYEYPEAIQEYDYKGKMYKIKSNQIDLLVTPNHKMYVRNRNKEKKYELKKAEDLMGKTVMYKKNVEEFIKDKDGQEYFELPIYEDEEVNVVEELDMDAWLIIFGVWMAEGCFLRDYAVSFATHKPRVKEALKTCFEKVGFDYKMHKDKKNDTIRNSWIVPNKHLVEFMSPYNVGAVEKFLPEWVWSLSQSQCRTLIHGMCLGDGHTMDNGTRRYDTSSTQLADDFQRLCLHAGWSCNKMLKYKAGHYSEFKDPERFEKEGGITSTVDAWRLTIITSQNEPKVNKDKKNNQHDEWIDYIGKVNCCTVSSGVIYVRRNGVTQWSGNSRHGQKGTCGMTYPQEDLPFNDQGQVPDIIINTKCIPSRMTIAHMKEGLKSKEICLSGDMEQKCTSFIDESVEEIMDKIKQFGYQGNGFETMYSGATGKMFKAQIYMVPTPYIRLKHMVDDKIHGRARGQMQILVRQPVEGRMRDGGLRVGEMERDALISHGASKFLRQELLLVSDKYKIYICSDCNQMGYIDPKTKTGLCKVCGSSHLVPVIIPYAAKLLAQELMAMNINVKWLIEARGSEFVLKINN